MTICLKNAVHDCHELERSTKERMSRERDLLHIPWQQTRQQLSWMCRLYELITSLCEAMYCNIFVPFFSWSPDWWNSEGRCGDPLGCVWRWVHIHTKHALLQSTEDWKDLVHGHANQHQLYPQLATRASKISGEQEKNISATLVSVFWNTPSRNYYIFFAVGTTFSSKGQYGNNRSAVNNHLPESLFKLANGDGTVN